MRIRALPLLIAPFLLANLGTANAQIDERPLLELDGSTFVTFYDLPSRRFRSIRQAVIARDFAGAQRDIEVTRQYLAIETKRSHPKLAGPLAAVDEQLSALGAGLESLETTVQDFDSVFARVHWLLAQHFLLNAVQSRNAVRYKEASNYLIASAHHMERAVLWSNARITPDLERSLDGLRTSAIRLAKNPNQRWVDENKPVRRAAKLLEQIGAHLDRQVIVRSS